MGYSSFDCIKNPRKYGENQQFVPNDYEDNIPLISQMKPNSLCDTNQLEEEDGRNSSKSSEASYYSCTPKIPSKKDKKVFFKILKYLLEDQSILREGKEEVRLCDKSQLKLKYMGRECKAFILDVDGNEIWEEVIETKYIYLNWRGDEVEPLSLENLQIVQNELKFLGIQNKEVCDCFSLARTKFMEEQNSTQKKMKVKIICCNVILTFGKGKNIATVLYDDIEGIPKYNMKMAHWYTRLIRNARLFATRLGLFFRGVRSFFSFIKPLLACFARFRSIFNKYKRL